MISPSSSSSSLDSVFDQSRSRSTSPSSVNSSILSSPKLARAGAGPTPCSTPSIYVCVPYTTTVQPDLLSSVFDIHSQDGTLGLCVSNGINCEVNSPSFFKGWSEVDVTVQTRGKTVKVLVSCPGQFSVSREDVDLGMPASLSSHAAQHLTSFSLARLRAVTSTPLLSGYIAYTLERPPFNYTPLALTPGFTLSSKPSSGNIPTLDEWKNVWATWDLVTLQMIPREMLHQKPIDLRHKCLFYIGHIPTFLDMLLSKAIGGEASEPQYFWNIFERGIDPHVDDPDHCHNHSEVPEKDEDWPVLETIIGFRNNVRKRLIGLYHDLHTGKQRLTRTIARTLVMTLEHEGFHIETLLYMLIQRAGTAGGTLPPPGFTSPPWDSLAAQWDSHPLPATPTVVLGPATITLGHDDSEAHDVLPGIADIVDDHVFGWDNESPKRPLDVGAFRAEWRPVTNGEFEAFWRTQWGADVARVPGSWVCDPAPGDGGEVEVRVRTMYGPVSMAVARHWPVLTSYDDLLAYAKSKGGRLPTEGELRLFLDRYEVGHEGGSNTGFRNWHPVPATAGLECKDGKGSNGGVWEWTTTLFDTHDGLAPTKLFTGYSTDFFDTKHHVVLGASYATIPRLASRRTVRNFYQHNYPYPWVGGRVVYDL
ncbi:hypothetical protein H0H92_001163, partial [Tricholoma furcatifolium]